MGGYWRVKTLTRAWLSWQVSSPSPDRYGECLHRRLISVLQPFPIFCGYSNILLRIGSPHLLHPLIVIEIKPLLKNCPAARVGVDLITIVHSVSAKATKLRHEFFRVAGKVFFVASTAEIPFCSFPRIANLFVAHDAFLL